MLMRNTSAPASNSLRIIALSEEAGPSVATILMRRRRLIASGRRLADGSAPGLDRLEPAPGPPGPTVPGMPGTRCGGLFAGFGQLHGPGALFAGIDLEEAGAVEAARQAILGAADGEFLVARTHEGLSRPFAAAVIVDRVDVIISRDERSAQQRLAAARGHVPPAFGGPALGVLVAERDADPAGGVVAEPEIGRRRTAPQARHRQRQHRQPDRRSCERRGGSEGENLLQSCGEAISDH